MTSRNPKQKNFKEQFFFFFEFYLHRFLLNFLGRKIKEGKFSIQSLYTYPEADCIYLRTFIFFLKRQKHKQIGIKSKIPIYYLSFFAAAADFKRLKSQNFPNNFGFEKSTELLQLHNKLSSGARKLSNWKRENLHKIF